MRILHTQAFRFPVHHVDKACLAARDIFGQHDRCIVARIHDQSAQQLIHGYSLSCFQQHARIPARVPHCNEWDIQLLV